MGTFDIAVGKEMEPILQAIELEASVLIEADITAAEYAQIVSLIPPEPINNSHFLLAIPLLLVIFWRILRE